MQGSVGAGGTVILVGIGYFIGKKLGFWGKNDAKCKPCRRKQPRKAAVNDNEFDESLAFPPSHSPWPLSYTSPHSYSDGSAPYSSSEQRKLYLIAHPPQSSNNWRENSQSQGPWTRENSRAIPEINNNTPNADTYGIELSSGIKSSQTVDPQLPQRPLRPTPSYDHPLSMEF